MKIMQSDRIIGIARRGERYVFIVDEESRDELLRELGRMATDADLSFDWFDAAVVSQRLRGDEP